MCGIIGFSGKDKQNYNIDKLKLLIYSNSIERKSTDSTGFYFKGIKDNIPVKSIINAKDFIGNNEIFRKLEPSTMFIGHVRSKSVGNNSLENAHPYKIGNIIGVHNGTITNIKEISEKYANEYYTNKTDSYNLFNTLYLYHKPKPLSKITGGTAVLFTDTMQEDLLYVYRNNDRELYYTILPEGMYISSERASLKMVAEDNDVFAFKEGFFYAIKDSKIIEEFKIVTKPMVTNLNKNVNNKYPARLANRWLYCIKNDEFNKLKAGEWYFTDKSTTYTANETFFTIVSGKLSTHKNIKEPIKHVSSDFFDMNLNYLSYSYQEIQGRIVKFVYSIYNDKGVLLSEIGDYGIVNSKNYQNDKYTIYNPLRDDTITGIDESDIRICLPSEENDLGVFLTTIEEEIGNEIKNIKFTPIDEEVINEKVTEFNKKLISELSNLSKLIETNDIDKTKETIKKLEKELNNIY